MPCDAGLAAAAAQWLPKYPDIKVEISGDNRFVDIVAERYDIGVRRVPTWPRT